MKIMVFGSSGGIGSAVVSALQDHDVIECGRDQVNFAVPDSDSRVRRLLTIHDPDVIINCAGSFNDDHVTHHEMFDVNLGSNWSLIRYYLERADQPIKPVKIIMLGSSAYESGRRNYMLYASSKAALHNLWQGARERFEGTPVAIDIIHPVKTRTRMLNRDTSPNKLEPEDVAAVVVDRISRMSGSDMIRMTYKETK
jgi:ribitol-5-phosphate 2-dehydrogenase (NADP+) / D-ribitol-5-phosphate cytidylyltransferase